MAERPKLYVLGPLGERVPCRHYAMTRDEICQMAIDRYWGTTFKPPADRLRVVVNLIGSPPTVTILDSYEDTKAVYKILVYERLMV